jgi:uncharacterized protein
MAFGVSTAALHWMRGRAKQVARLVRSSLGPARLMRLATGGPMSDREILQGGWASRPFGQSLGRMSGYLLLAAIMAGQVAVAAASAAADRPVRSLREIRHEAVIVQKFDLSCGAAALATLLNFQFGDRVTEKEITEGLIRRKEYIENPELVRVRQGFSLLDMKRYVTTRGYVGVGYGKLELKDLLDLAPIIVPVSPIGYNHFVILRGIIGDQVLLADPAFGNRTMSVEKFERIWIDFPDTGKVGFIISRDGKPAPPGRLAPQAAQIVTPPAALVRDALFH